MLYVMLMIWYNNYLNVIILIELGDKKEKEG